MSPFYRRKTEDRYRAQSLSQCVIEKAGCGIPSSRSYLLCWARENLPEPSSVSPPPRKKAWICNSRLWNQARRDFWLFVSTLPQRFTETLSYLFPCCHRGSRTQRRARWVGKRSRRLLRVAVASQGPPPPGHCRGDVPPSDPQERQSPEAVTVMVAGSPEWVRGHRPPHSFQERGRRGMMSPAGTPACWKGQRQEQRPR